MAAAVGTVEAPAGQIPTYGAESSGELHDVPAMDLARELLTRMRNEQIWPDDSVNTFLGYELEARLREQLDLHNNRFSTRRYRDLYHNLFGRVKDKPSLKGATVVDMGCGGVNPFGLLTLFTTLGARRGIALDLDSIYDGGIAVRAAADVVKTMLTEPDAVLPKGAPSGPKVMANLSRFDLSKLCKGDPTGFNGTIEYKQESVDETSIGTGEADLILSNAFLEHVSDIDKAFSELARITRRGGMGVHVIDMTDHRRYVEERHPFDFLTDPGDGMAQGSNRLRYHEFLEAFGRHRFKVVAASSEMDIGIPDEMKRRLSPKFAAMSDEQLKPAIAHVVVRRA